MYIRDMYSICFSMSSHVSIFCVVLQVMSGLYDDEYIDIYA